MVLKAIKGLVKSGKGEMLAVGAEAPDFVLTAHDGSTVTLSEQRGHRVLLWFYPKADTPG